MNLLTPPPFTLSARLTEEQVRFFEEQGVILFKNFINPTTADLLISEVQRIEKQWLQEGRTKVNGVPLRFGQTAEGAPTIQRLPFCSQFSPYIAKFLDDVRFGALHRLMAPYHVRIGSGEKDGMVVNNYIQEKGSGFSKMGWHTDSPRDFFLGQRIMPMLNAGIYLDDSPARHGGLRVLPGSHRQGLLRLLFGKRYFVDHKADPNEYGLDVQKGDLTVHDGRLWHRVQQSPLTGERSRRRVLYIPFITGKYLPKNESSHTPFYHRFSSSFVR